MSNMFNNAHNLTNLDISSFNTSNVTDMTNMFVSTRSLTSLDLSNFNTSNVTNMSSMFWGMQTLTSLDLSSFDTRNVLFMGSMFGGTGNLRNLTLGANFAFRDISQLPPIPTNDTYTGYWQNIGVGTTDSPLGQFVLTSQQLMSTFNGATMADTFVWQPISAVPTTHQITLDIYPDNQPPTDTPRDYETPNTDNDTGYYYPDCPGYYETPNTNDNTSYYYLTHQKYAI